MRRSARAVAGFISSSNGLIVVSVVVLVTATSVLSDPQLVFPAEPAPSNWSGLLQYNDTIRDGRERRSGLLLSEWTVFPKLDRHPLLAFPVFDGLPLHLRRSGIGD